MRNETVARFLKAAPVALVVALACQSLIGCAAGTSIKAGYTFSPAESIRAANAAPARYDEHAELTRLIERTAK